MTLTKGFMNLVYRMWLHLDRQIDCHTLFTSPAVRTPPIPPSRAVSIYKSQIKKRVKSALRIFGATSVGIDLLSPF
ncbi:MAG: hypothetical protein V3S30_11965 [Thermoanaerobaculia bacterium]